MPERTYAEPTVIWRMRHPDGFRAHATLIPGTPASTLSWYVDSEMVRAENFNEWAMALARAEEIKAAFAQNGWTTEE